MTLSAPKLTIFKKQMFLFKKNISFFSIQYQTITFQIKTPLLTMTTLRSSKFAFKKVGNLTNFGLKK